MALVVFLSLLYLAFQGTRGISKPDECYYVPAAAQMMESGDYVLPRLLNRVYLDKPPMVYWGVAAGMHALGINEWGARLFHALCGIFTALFVYGIGRVLQNRTAGLLAAAMYGTMVLSYAAPAIVTPDTPLTLFSTAIFFFFAKSLRDPRRATLWKLAMCLACALGFLSKSVAIFVPLSALAAFLVLRRRVWSFLRGYWLPAGALLFGAVALPWFLLVNHRLPGALDYFLNNHIVGRLVSEEYRRNPGLLGAWVYLKAILYGTLPWSVIALAIAWRRRPSWPVLPARLRQLLAAEDLPLLSLLWMALPLCALCLASSKLPLYLLPLMPAFALLFAWICLRGEGQWQPGLFGLPRKLLYPLAAMALLFVTLKAAAGYLPAARDTRRLAAQLEIHVPDDYGILFTSEHIEAISLYLPEHTVEMASDSSKGYPQFQPPPRLEEEFFPRMQTGERLAALLLNRKRYLRYRDRLVAAGIPYEAHAIEFDRFLVFTPPRPAGQSYAGHVPLRKR